MIDPIRARIESRIAAELAKPNTHVVTTTFNDGMTRRLEVTSENAAENYAIGERRKIGRDLIRRNADLTEGPTVRIVSVAISRITV